MLGLVLLLMAVALMGAVVVLAMNEAAEVAVCMANSPKTERSSILFTDDELLFLDRRERKRPSLRCARRRKKRTGWQN